MQPPDSVWLGVERYGIKLAKALYYFHFGQIVPLTDAVLVPLLVFFIYVDR